MNNLRLLIEAILNEEDIKDKYGHLILTDLPKFKPNRFEKPDGVVLPDEDIIKALHPLISFSKEKAGEGYELLLAKMIAYLNKSENKQKGLNRLTGGCNQMFGSAFSEDQVKKMIEAFKMATNLLAYDNLVSFYNQAVDYHNLELPKYQPSKNLPREPTQKLDESVLDENLLKNLFNKFIRKPEEITADDLEPIDDDDEPFYYKAVRDYHQALKNGVNKEEALKTYLHPAIDKLAEEIRARWEERQKNIPTQLGPEDIEDDVTELGIDDIDLEDDEYTQNVAKGNIDESKLKKLILEQITEIKKEKFSKILYK